MRAATFLTLLAFLCLTGSPAIAEQGTVVSRLGDKQIVEASGLAISAAIPDLAYTLNDSGNKPMVYAIRISTGQTVGRADLSRYKLEDTESLYVDPRGQMWVGDLGDNDHNRNDVSILRFPEPGVGKHKIVAAERFGVRYNDGKADVEGMLVNPVSGQVFLASRNRVGGAGTVYALPALQPGARNIATNMNVQLPADVSDGTFSTDGSLVLLRTPSSVWVANPQSWKMLRQISLPQPQKSESITFERGDQTFLVGGEGEKSPLIRAALPLKPAAPDAAEPKQNRTTAAEPANKSEDFQPASEPATARGISTAVIVAASIALAGALVIAAAVLRRRR